MTFPGVTEWGRPCPVHWLASRWFPAPNAPPALPGLWCEHEKLLRLRLGVMPPLSPESLRVKIPVLATRDEPESTST